MTICHVAAAVLVVEETLMGPYLRVIPFLKDSEEEERWMLTMPNEKESLCRLNVLDKLSSSSFISNKSADHLDFFS